jgi:hypothetical protein
MQLQDWKVVHIYYYFTSCYQIVCTRDHVFAVIMNIMKSQIRTYDLLGIDKLNTIIRPVGNWYIFYKNQINDLSIWSGKLYQETIAILINFRCTTIGKLLWNETTIWDSVRWNGIESFYIILIWSEVYCKDMLLKLS